MNEDSSLVADLVAFSVIGINVTTQHLSHVAAGEASDDLELIAEESLAVTSVTTERVLSFVLREAPSRAAVLAAVGQTPFRYYDYILGNQVLEMRDESSDIDLDSTSSVFNRVGRKVAFYGSHFPEAAFPGASITREKMVLWMGRISSPGLHEHPEKRLERLGLANILQRHLRLVQGYTLQRLEAEVES
ncbi:MAG: hypothetical protein HKN43_09400 [Rhodothermales bacterium]|nr:hypothetical protein [Rhodothermales bacterium]